VDLNLTLTGWGPINKILNQLKNLGYFNRPLSSRLYLAIILALVSLQIYLLLAKFTQRTVLKKLLLLALAVALIASLSYPFLSHDLFSYLFDAKIVWHYQKNPYQFSPDQFGSDPWLRFMHWTHRTYPYGPTWLIFTLIPAIFSFGRFIINFYGLKLFSGLAFFISGWFLLKINNNDRRVFAYWFFNPFLLIEFLVNGHNDLLMIGLFFAALFFSQSKKSFLKAISFLASLGTKFISGLALPLLIFKRRRFWATLFVFCSLVGFAWQIGRFQPWYFSWLYLAWPLMAITNFSWVLIFIFQALLLIFKYQPFLATGSWQGTGHNLLFQVLLISLAIFFLTLLPIFKKIIGRLLSLPLEEQD
ncbi:MAG: hypothetical protein ACOYJ8_03080, partial [Patescibacteria group bacterium]